MMMLLVYTPYVITRYINVIAYDVKIRLVMLHIPYSANNQRLDTQIHVVLHLALI